jgi:hypothetical protein
MLAILLMAALAGPAPGASPATPSTTPAEGRVVERIVAVVRSPGLPPRPITLTRLTEEARVAMVGQGALEAATAPLDVPALRAALRWLIGQWLVADEAVRLKVDEVPREEVEDAKRRFQARFATPAAYQAFLAAAEVGDREVAVMLARDLRVRRYLVSRAGRAGQVSDEELERELGDHPPSGASLADREEVRGRLELAKLKAAFLQQVADLRARVEVRVLVPELRDGPEPREDTPR